MEIDVSSLKAFGFWLIQHVFHPFAVFATPVITIGLILLLLVRAFRLSVKEGIRSLSAVLLPLVVLTFAFMYEKRLFAEIGNVPTPVSFVAALAVGIAVMVVTRYLATLAYFIPFAEILLSGALTLLVFSYLSLQKSGVLAYCYGMLSGFLVFVILLGVPLVFRKRDEEPEVIPE
ncbi:MAG: hypothetical protein ACM3NF_10360 [Gemmatimonadota bacterium]